MEPLGRERERMELKSSISDMTKLFSDTPVATLLIYTKRVGSYRVVTNSISLDLHNLFVHRSRRHRD